MKRWRPNQFQTGTLNRKLRRNRAARAEDWQSSLTPAGSAGPAETEVMISRFPMVLLAGFGALVLAALLLQLFNLQFVQGDRLRDVAEGNRVREQITYAPRGDILDRNGEVLATSRPSYQISVTPYLLPVEEKERTELYEQVATYIDKTPSEVAVNAEEEGLAYPQQQVVADGLDHDVALELSYVLPDLPGFTVDSVPVREYKSEAALAHIIGYVGRVSEEELDVNTDLHPTDFIGKRGIEQQYDDQLRGENGVVETEVDATGTPLRTLRERGTTSGEDVKLTIDYELQQEVYAAVQRQLDASGQDSGAAVVQNPTTGEVLASVSVPGYDNNLFSEGVSQDDYQGLLNDPQQPMLNRAADGGYPTGSTIKPFNLMGALETNTVSEDTVIQDRGAITVRSQHDPSQSFTFRGWDESGLGPVNAQRALALSSNIYFYITAGGYEDRSGMGVDNLVRYYRAFGFDSETGIDLPNETAGHIPDPDWKQEQTGMPWFVGDTYNLGIGQGDLLISPLQLNRAYGAIATDGQLMRPRLLYGQEPDVQERLDFNPDHYRITQEGLEEVIGWSGTVSPTDFDPLPVRAAGKTGTAETDPGARDPHAWFSGYAPHDNPEVVVTVFLENAEGSSEYAAPGGGEILQAYYDR